MFPIRLNASLRTGSSKIRVCVANAINERKNIQSSTSNEISNPSINFKNSIANAVYWRSCKYDWSKCLQSGVRSYATSAESRKENAFGDLDDRKFERVEMDEDEKKEQEFVENEARVFRQHRLTPGGYANLIKSRITKGDLDGAAKVLDDVAKNRDEATTYMYTLLLRAYATAGNFKKCRSLYATMKKRGIKCNDATYTSIINVCANYHHSETAIEYLEGLRQEFEEKNINLNNTHYNTMIKAYGRHNQMLKAFEIADVMRDKRLPTDVVTFNTLLSAATSDKTFGLRHALVIWHMMSRHKITPDVTSYNIFLRAVRDCGLGNLKANDVLISAEPRCQVFLGQSTRVTLFDNPPMISTYTLREIGGKEEEPESSGEKAEGKEKALIRANPEEKSLVTEDALLKIPLGKIHKKNKLILFGGLTGIMESMERHQVKPEIKTITILMELAPSTAHAEKEIMKVARAKNVDLDIDFFNMLMKKRSVRRDYKGAKDVLDDVQRCGLCPDIITWGILAMGCWTLDDARQLLAGMKTTGHRLNVVIAGTLINIACRRVRFRYLLEMMSLMSLYHIKPNYEMWVRLDSFRKEVIGMINSKKFHRTVNTPEFKSGFAAFNEKYEKWQKDMGRKLEDIK